MFQKAFSAPQKHPIPNTARSIPSGNGGSSRFPLTKWRSGTAISAERPGRASSVAIIRVLWLPSRNRTCTSSAVTGCNGPAAWSVPTVDSSLAAPDHGDPRPLVVDRRGERGLLVLSGPVGDAGHDIGPGPGHGELVVVAEEGSAPGEGCEAHVGVLAVHAQGRAERLPAVQRLLVVRIHVRAHLAHARRLPALQVTDPEAPVRAHCEHRVVVIDPVVLRAGVHPLQLVPGLAL